MYYWTYWDVRLVKDKDVGSNPAATRNEKTDIGKIPHAQKVAQWSGQDLSGRPAM